MQKNPPRPEFRPFNHHLRFSIEETAYHLGVSRAHVWKRVQSGEIKTIADGRRRFVPGTEIARLSAVQS